MYISSYVVRPGTFVIYCWRSADFHVASGKQLVPWLPTWHACRRLYPHVGNDELPEPSSFVGWPFVCSSALLCVDRQAQLVDSTQKQQQHRHPHRSIVLVWTNACERRIMMSKMQNVEKPAWKRSTLLTALVCHTPLYGLLYMHTSCALTSVCYCLRSSELS